MMNESGKAVAPPGPAPTDAAVLRQLNAQLEQRVAERTAELQAILDLAPVAVWIAHDAQCLQITGNRYADELVMQAPRGGNISASARPGDAAVSYKVLRDGVELKPEELPAQMAAATGKAVAAQMLDLVFPDGRAAHMFMGSVPLFDAGGFVRGAVGETNYDDKGRSVRMSGLCMDVTRRRMAEDALCASEERYRTLVELAPGAVIVEQDGRFVFANPAAVRLYGADTPDQLIGRSVLEFVHPDDRERVRRAGDGSFAGETSPLRDVRVLRVDGQATWTDGSSIPVDFGGRPAIQVMIHDVTGRKNAEDEIRRSMEELRVANEELTRFNRAAVDRELRMIELKKQVNELCAKVGEPPRYKLEFERDKAHNDQ